MLLEEGGGGGMLFWFGLAQVGFDMFIYVDVWYNSIIVVWCNEV